MRVRHKGVLRECKRAGKWGEQAISSASSIKLRTVLHRRLMKGAELGGNLGYIEGTLLIWRFQGALKTERYAAILSLQRT
jgi:hypothetical protein